MPEDIRRLSREEAAKFIGCGLNKLTELVKSGALKGTYYTFGKRIIFIASKLEEWMLNGGELGAYERRHNLRVISNRNVK